MRIWIGLLSGIVGVISATGASALTFFQVGNSLTWDSHPPSIREMALAAGFEWTAGYQIKPASSLKTIWDDPTANGTGERSVPGPTYVEGLADYDWTALALQPHNTQGATLGEDLQYAQNFISQARSDGRNTQMQVYVYSTWSTLSGWSGWESPVGTSPSQPMVRRRQYFQNLASLLEDTLEEQVNIIPAGDVFFRLKQEIEAGNVPNLTTVDDLYRDDIHGSLTYGRFVAGTAIFATIGRANPIGLPVASNYAQYGTLEAETVAVIQEIVWDVVANYPKSGVTTIPGDYDGNGAVEMADYEWWRKNFGKSNSYAADGNHDGTIDAADYTVWRDNFQPGGGASDGLPVPEPAVLSLTAIAAVAAMIHLLRPKSQR